MTERETVQLEPGYLLHQRPYRNTSQLLDCLTEQHGLVTLVARGSRRPRGGYRALLQPFAALQFSWVRRGDLGRLTHVEAVPPAFELTGERLLAGYYLNELLLRLMARGDPNDLVYSCYSRCLADLAARVKTSRALRLFELRLLAALGYGVGLEHDVETGEPIHPDRRYRFVTELGARALDSNAEGPDTFSGSELISLREERLDDDRSLRAAKRLLGSVLQEYLGDRPLSTRSVLKDVFERGLDQ